MGIVALNCHNWVLQETSKLQSVDIIEHAKLIEMFPTNSHEKLYSNSPRGRNQRSRAPKLIASFHSYSCSRSLYPSLFSFDLLFQASAFYAYIEFHWMKIRPSLSIYASFDFYFPRRNSPVDVNQPLFDSACVADSRESAKTSTAVDWLSHCPFSLVLRSLSHSRPIHSAKFDSAQWPRLKRESETNEKATFTLT